MPRKQNRDCTTSANTLQQRESVSLLGWFGILMLSTLLTATTDLIIDFVAAPPVDMNSICKPVAGSIPYLRSCILKYHSLN